MSRFALLFFPIFLWAVDVAQVQQMVQQNPSLLSTPEAKAFMKEKGIEAPDAAESVVTVEAEANVVEETVEDDDRKVKKHEVRTQTRFVNPLKYRSNREVLQQVLDKQQRADEKALERFSKSFFYNKNRVDISSLPTPDYYVVTTGDVLDLWVYGDRNNKYALTVKGDGTVEIPYIGPVGVANQTFDHVRTRLIKVLEKNFKNAKFDVAMGKYSTIQVTLVGEVRAPGIYNLSSFSTPKDLLITAGGIAKTASVRDVVVKRGGKVLAHLDFYDLIKKGNALDELLLKHGDVVVIKKAKKLVSVDGEVYNAAVFELKEGENLDKAIDYSGGLMPGASKENIRVKRYSGNALEQTFSISYAKSGRLAAKDGDVLYVYPLDFTANRSVNFYGNIIRPGRYSLTDEKTLNALLKKELARGKAEFFLPNTCFSYVLVRRYGSDLQHEVLSYDLEKVINNEVSVPLQPQDAVYFYNTNDIFTNSYVTVKGSVLINPGRMQYVAGVALKDAVNFAGINGVLDDKVRVTTFNTFDNMPHTRFVSLKENGDYKLSPYDEVEVFDFYNTHPIDTVRVKGEVVNPVELYYQEGMSVQELVDAAGGLKKQAYTKSLEIVRYFVDENQTRQREIVKFDLQEGGMGDIVLQPYDEVTIFKIPKWSERKTVTVSGQVKFPGVYAIEDGEHLADVLRRAGGFTDEAFVEGTVFTRESIRKEQVANQKQNMARIKRELAIYGAMPANSKKTAASGANPLAALNEVIAQGEKYQPIGRVSISLQRDLQAFAKTPYNIILKDKDAVIIPSQIDTVTVFGEVFNASSYIYNPDYDVEDYIKLASGVTKSADDDRIYVIHADGTSEPWENGFFSAMADVKKGDTIVVPLYIKEIDSIEFMESVSRILANFAVTAATLKTVGVID